MFVSNDELHTTVCIDIVRFWTASSICSFVFNEIFKLVEFYRFSEKRFQLTGSFAREGRGEFRDILPFICRRAELWSHVG